MRGRILRPRVIAVIILKDLREFSRDRLWMILTPVSLVFVIAVFLLVPDDTGFSITVGVYPERVAEYSRLFQDDSEGIRLRVLGFSNREDLAEEFSTRGGGHGLSAGIAFPPDYPSGLHSDEGAGVSLWFSASVPPGMRRALVSGIREMGHAIDAAFSGRDPMEQLPVKLPELSYIFPHGEGEGPGVPMRRRMRPMLVILVLLVEALALAGLVSMEIAHGTAEAILVTPAGTSDFLAAKCATGLILAAGQAVLFLLATGAFSMDWMLVSCLILLGAGMASAVGMLSGAGGRDFVGTIFFGMLFIIPLMVPAFSVLFPGRPSLLVRLLPSYGLVESFHGVLGQGKGWDFAAPHIITTAAWLAVLMATALALLRRRVRSL